MLLTRKDLELAVDQGVLDAARAEGLWAFLLRKNAQRPQFDLQHLLYYFGALLVIAAGVQYRRHGEALERVVLAALPGWLRNGLPQYRRGLRD